MVPWLIWGRGLLILSIILNLLNWLRKQWSYMYLGITYETEYFDSWIYTLMQNYYSSEIPIKISIITWS